MFLGVVRKISPFFVGRGGVPKIFPEFCEFRTAEQFRIPDLRDRNCFLPEMGSFPKIARLIYGRSITSQILNVADGENSPDVRASVTLENPFGFGRKGTATGLGSTGWCEPKGTR